MIYPNRGYRNRYNINIKYNIMVNMVLFQSIHMSLNLIIYDLLFLTNDRYSSDLIYRVNLNLILV
jgi:hypothetical protein